MEAQVMNLKKQVKEKQHKTEKITNTSDDENKMMIELKEDNSKSKESFQC